jgi:antitoxin component of RelBE/YafQ-DinJ toxin-antitoxin module
MARATLEFVECRWCSISPRNEHVLPFDPLLPNAETVEAMLEARRGGLASFDNVRTLLADLHADAQATD